MWVDILGFEGLYQVNTEGKVRSLERRQPSGNGGFRTLKSKVLKWRKNTYPMVCLSKNGKVYQKYVHQLVAEAFIGPRPEGKYIDHIDENKYNACASNLQYITQSDNMLKHYGGKR